MATYNGAEYIDEQIASIINQSYRDWILIASDDGSKDCTVQILERYARIDSRIIIIKNEGIHGAYSNFWNAIEWYKRKHGRAKWFFYCDQDDIWTENKMEIEVGELKRLSPTDGSPCLVYSDLALMNRAGSLLGTRLSDYTDIDLSENPLNIFFSHRYIWGTTMAHNSSLWNTVVVPVEHNRNKLSHDHYIPKYAVLLGKVKYIDSPLVLYRRHGSNVSEIPASYSLAKGAVRAVTQWRSVVENHAHTYWASIQVLKSMACQTEAGSELMRCFQQGGVFGVRYLIFNHIRTSKNLFNLLALYMIMLFKLYQYTSWFNKLVN